jgi:dihydropteroate synthase
MTYLESLQEARRARLQRLGCLPVSSRVQPIAPAVVPEEPEPAEVVHIAVEPEPLPPPITPLLTSRAICRFVAERYQVPMEFMHSQRKPAWVVRPRQIGMFLSHWLCRSTLSQIGAAFGGRDHTTCLHAIQKFNRLSREDIEIAAELAEVELAIRARYNSEPAA